MPLCIGRRLGFMKFAENIVRFRSNPKARNREELAFLPAALEIVETPPSPTGYILAYVVIVLFCVTLGWAFFGKVDIVVVAQGKIIPSGRTKVVQPFDTGVVRAIDVSDGQSVKSGDVLIELDPTIVRAEFGHVNSDLMATRLEIARLRAALAGREDPAPDFQPPEGVSSEAAETHRRLLSSRAAEQRAKIEEIKRQEAQKEAERATIRATINKLSLARRFRCCKSGWMFVNTLPIGNSVRSCCI
jgi:hemolysin D